MFICGHEQESFILLKKLYFRHTRDNSSFSKDAMHHFQIRMIFRKPRFRWKWLQKISTMHIVLSATITKIKQSIIGITFSHLIISDYSLHCLPACMHVGHFSYMIFIHYQYLIWCMNKKYCDSTCPAPSAMFIYFLYLN